MALNDYQMSYNGLTFGAGTGIGLEVISGFEDFKVRSGDSAVPRGWGDVPGLHTVDSREVVLELYALTDADFESILDAFQPRSVPAELRLAEPHFGERLVYARPLARAFTRNPVHKFKKMVTIRLKLADPRIYGDETTWVIPQYDSGGGGGLDYDLDYSLDFTGTEGGGDTTVTNNGNSDAYPVLVIYAPTSGTTLTATFTNLTNDETAGFTFATDLSSGDIFTADMRRIVTVDPADTPYIRLGATNRYGDWDLPRTPFRIPPGSHDIRFEISGTGTDASASLTLRDTDL